MENKGTSSKKKGFSFLLMLAKNIHLNISTFIFAALVLYMVVTFFIYVGSNKITSYLVTRGPLDKNVTYTGLVVRQEKIYQAATGGYIHYHIREGNKIAKNGAVYSLSDSKASLQRTSLTREAQKDIQAIYERYSLNYDSNDFHSVYNLKYEVEGSILDYVKDGETGSATACLSDNDGIVVYEKDGFEEFKEEDLTDKIFSKKSYKKINLKTSEKIKAGSDVFKLVEDENWSVYIPLTNKQMAQLASKSTIKVRFQKDGVSQIANISIIVSEDNIYAKLSFSSGMIRYINDRFLDVELVTNTEAGLKIPISSIVKKEFYTIPREYLTYGGNTNAQAGFLKEVFTKSGESTTLFVPVTLFKTEEDLVYIDKKSFKKGDILVKENSSDRYTVEDTGSMDGVYSINKGYAVFRQVLIIDQDEEYCIVKEGQDYSIAQFDHIVLNGKTVKEDDIFY